MEPINASNSAQGLAERDGHDLAVLEPISLPTPEQESFKTPQPRSKNIKKLVLIALLGAGAIAATIFGYRWWRFASTHQETEDAYITADIHPINARIAGTVIEVKVKDNQVVSKGATLARLDLRDFNVALKQAQASLASAQEQASVAQANIGVSQANVEVSQATTDVTTTNAQGQTTQAQGNIDAAVASISTAQAAVLEAQAGVPATEAQRQQVEANLIKAQLDYKRYISLSQSGAIPRQQLDAAKATYDAFVAQRTAVDAQIRQAKARVIQAQQNLSNTQSKLAATRGTLQQANAGNQQAEVNRRQTQTSQRQSEVSQRQYKAALAAIAQAQAQVDNAQLQLSYANIVAPTAGQVGNKTIQVGQRVQPGQTLMSVVSQRPWIVANFKETQLGKMKPGQAVEIKIDAFSNRTFHGKVDSRSPASGARFSLLPPDNATGNFTKIVQRLPVKVVFDRDSIKGYESQISPGMSAVVTVEIP
jgi:membrane fusion protein, multidrug efflux system